MAKPKIFVSFDFENDRSYKYTLNMWNANSSFEFTCNKMLMPILFALINIVRIHKEWILPQESIIALVFDTILCVAIIIIDWFYFFEIHTKITEFCKKHVPFINSIANGLRKVLKEV